MPRLTAEGNPDFLFYISLVCFVQDRLMFLAVPTRLDTGYFVLILKVCSGPPSPSLPSRHEVGRLRGLTSVLF